MSANTFTCIKLDNESIEISYVLVIFPIVTSGAALIFAGAAAGTSILPTVAAGALGVLGLGMMGMNLHCACFPYLLI